MDRVAAVAVALVLVVSCGSDDPGTVAADEPATSEAARPDFGDHWHAAYGIWVCDRFLSPLTDLHGDRFGIHTHDDGLIHIHPTSGRATGPNATLGVFADEVGLELDEGSFTLPDGTRHATGDDCGGEEAEVQVLAWEPDGLDGEPTVHTSDLGEIPLDADGKAYTIGLVRPGTPTSDLLPPSLVVDMPDPPLGIEPLEDPPTCEPDLLALFEDEEGVRLHPVVDAAPRPNPHPYEGDAAGVCLGYDLGRPLPADLFAEATSTEQLPGDETWVVLPTLQPGSPGIDDFNELAAECFERSPICPTGQIAIVVGNYVISAPVIQSPSFARDAIQISGNLSREEARSLAALIG